MGDDVIRMQQEAAHRVQQMQERTRRLVSDMHPVEDRGTPVDHSRRTAESLEAVRQSAEARKAEHQQFRKEAMGDKPSCENKPGEQGGLLAGLTNDKERLFLLMLAVLLVNNGAKMELVVALLYLAM